MRQRNEKLWAERREVLRRVDESGMSAAEFCRREGIPYWKLMQWRRRIREFDAEESGDETEVPAFAELVVRDGPENTEDERAAPVEIALPGGAVVRVYSGADGRLLRDILEAAKRC